MAETPLHAAGGTDATTSGPRGPAWWIGRALLVAASMAFALYLCEAALLLFSGRLRDLDLLALHERGDIETYHRAVAARRLGQPFDTRSVFEVIQDTRAQGRYLAPAVSASVFVHFGLPLPIIDGAPTLPLGGISRTATIICNESGRYGEYASDEHGFRNPAGLYDQPVDIAVVGDSFAQGWCVADEHEPVAVLRARYRAVNLGVTGAGPWTALAILREYAERLKPKVVLWFVYEGNDFTDLSKELGSHQLTAYASPEFRQDLWSKQPAVDEALRGIVDTMLQERRASYQPPGGTARTLGSLAGRAARLSFVRERVRAGWSTPPASADEDAFETVARLAMGAVKGWGGRLVIVYLPEITRFSRRGGMSLNRSSVFGPAGRLGIPVIDIESAFASSPDPLGFWPYRRPGHYAVAGYARLAAAVLEWLSVNFDRA